MGERLRKRFHRNNHPAYERLKQTTDSGAETNLRVIANAVPSLVARISKEERYLFANEAYRSWYRLAPHEIEGKLVREVLSPEAYATFKPYMSRALNGEAASCDGRLKLPDGRELYVNANYIPDFNEQGEVRSVVALVNDVTRIYQLLQSLQEEREVRDRFVAMLTHDLRTPLASAKINAQLILRSKEDAQRVEALSRRIEDNVERADQMIQDLLDANRIKVGEGISIDLRECDLTEVIEAAIDELKLVYGERFVLKKDGPLVGLWDCHGLRRVIENLCSNAVKYGAPDAPVTINLSAAGGIVEIAVHNLGQPISERDRAALFVPFKRIASPANGEKKGWGIGLTIVRGVVSAHGGSIAVDSSAERGTTFTVLLPRAGS